MILLQNLDWENSCGVEGEIGIVIKIYELDDEENFFDFLVALGDGTHLPVWAGEVEWLNDNQV